MNKYPASLLMLKKETPVAAAVAVNATISTQLYKKIKFWFKYFFILEY